MLKANANRASRWAPRDKGRIPVIWPRLTVPATASVVLKGFPKLEVSGESEERDGVTEKRPCIY